jgi:hypothetical protein
MVEQTDTSKLSSSQIQSSADRAENNKQQKHILDKQDQYLRMNVIDVFGKETERICDYLRCHHKFSEHGLRQIDSLQHILFDYSLNTSLKEYFRRRQDGLKVAV